MTLREQLNIELDNIIKDIKERMSSKNATGKMSKSLRKELIESDNKIIGTVYAHKYFKVTETGRRPTPNKKPSREMIENISDWAESKGLGSDTAWPIAITIQKEGTKLFQSGGRQDIFTPSTGEQAMKGLTDRISEVAKKSFVESLIKVS